VAGGEGISGQPWREVLEQFQDYHPQAKLMRGCRSLMVASTLRTAVEA
jgi:hypothetical protein